MRRLTKLTLLAAATLTGATALAAPTDVHPAAHPTNNSFTYGVSGDGLTSVGYSNIGGGTKPFKIIGNAYTLLSPLTIGGNSIAYAASANGSLIVGSSSDGGGLDQAVAWSGITPTGLNNGYYYSSVATGVSANGGVVVGHGFDATTSFRDHAFYHQGGTLTVLDNSFGANASRATGVSANGNLLVGTQSDDFSNPTNAAGFIFNVTTSTVFAVGNPWSFVFTQLTAISGDGTSVIGYASPSGLAASGGEVAFQYEPGGSAFTPLGSLGTGTWAIPQAINADGSVIVGSSLNSSGNPEAFKYQNGIMTGLGFLTGGTLSTATGVSADGTVIVGHGNLTGGYTHAFVYANQTMLDATEWMRSLNGPGSLAAMATSLNSHSLEGAHHRPLMSYDAMGRTSQAWATGDFGTSSRQADRRISSGEIGASGTFGDFVVGGAAGRASLRQDLLFGGHTRLTGNTFLAEADYRLADKESILSLVLMRGVHDADATRGYVTGLGLDSSAGSTSLSATSVRLRYDGSARRFIGAVAAAPFAAFTLTRTSIDAYQETGGSFPASFAPQEHTAQEGRLGFVIKHLAAPGTTLRFTAEWIHRFDDAGDGLAGTSLTTATAFTVAGIAPTKNQARLGFDIDHKLTADTLLNFSVHATGVGATADVSGAISLRRGF